MKLLSDESSQKLFIEEFEQTLLRSAYSSLNNLNDPLRCNLFALILRELIRITMARIAPDENVKHAPWYTSEKTTRADRYRYALTGDLSDELIKKYPQLDTSSSRSELVRVVERLSKYAHISPDTYNLPYEKAQEFSNHVEAGVLRFAATMANLRETVENAVYDLVHDQIFDRLQNNMGELDDLSHQTLLDGVSDLEIVKVAFSGDEVLIHGCGTAEVELNYGRGEDGLSSSDSYPLSFNATVNLKTLAVVSMRIDTDTSSFYEEA